MDAETKAYIDDLTRQAFRATGTGIGIVISAIISQLDAQKLHTELHKQIHNAKAVGADPAAIRIANQALAAIEAQKARKEQH